MRLALIDWFWILFFLATVVAIGVYVGKRAGKDSNSFFLAGRNMPWWLLGASMVATTFSTDTPNLVTDIVRNDGVSGNWVWWAFLLTGMLTCFVYAKIWRRSGVVTDLEFYEIRYSGKAASAVRAFRALYLGVFFNVMVMALVTLAAIKIGAVILNLTPLQTVSIAGSVVVIFSAISGFPGVVLTDLLLFVVSMVGAICAAWVALSLPEVGGLEQLLTHPNVVDKLSFFPDFSNPEAALAVFVIPIAVQWWSVWYPGSEPGGGGYVAQRMLAAKNENHAMGAVLLFQLAHYALRPWPWILVALASLIVFPDLAAIRTAFPHIDEQVIGHDLAYPAMLTYLPHGLLGLVTASLTCAYMSTMSTQLNWGACYFVHDFYRRFLKPEASEKQLVLVGRIATVALMSMACALALLLETAIQAFNILLSIGAGTGLLFLLRWFWWRINAWSEIAAMVISFVVALCLHFMELPGWSHWQKLITGVLITTAGWLLVTFVTPPTQHRILCDFYRLVQPQGPGWNKVLMDARARGEAITPAALADGGITHALLSFFLACVCGYSALFCIGSLLYRNHATALALFMLVLLTAGALWKRWPTIWCQCPRRRTIQSSSCRE